MSPSAARPKITSQLINLFCFLFEEINLFCWSPRAVCLTKSTCCDVSPSPPPPPPPPPPSLHRHRCYLRRGSVERERHNLRHPAFVRAAAGHLPGHGHVLLSVGRRSPLGEPLRDLLRGIWLPPLLCPHCHRLSPLWILGRPLRHPGPPLPHLVRYRSHQGTTSSFISF